jgi:hypothetical protein
MPEMKKAERTRIVFVGLPEEPETNTEEIDIKISFACQF